jgi:uncharacterized membrane protein
VKQLVVLAYVDEHRAAEVLALLQRLHTGSAVQVDDAVAIVRATDWNVKLHHDMDLSDPEEPSAHFWRGLVASLVLAPGTGDCRRSGQDYGITPAFERELHAALPPGSSAVLMVMTGSTLERLSAELHQLGGTVLNTPITDCR